jgi:uncharacterized protein (DUF58 family)
MVALLFVAAPLVLAWLLRSLFTWRFLALAAAGMPFFLLGALYKWPLPAMLAVYDGILLGTYLLDYLLSARPRSFSLKRGMEEVLSLGAVNLIRVEAEYRGTHRTRVALRDEPPVEFAVAERNMAAVLKPGETVSFSYTVTPPRRGLFRFGQLHFRYRGRLGLVIRQARRDAAMEVKVYPDVLAVKKFDLLARVGRLAELGLRTGRLKGTGTNFESVREYTAGDEFRRINWSATARRGRPQSNEYQVEQTQNIFLLLDAGRMMVTRAGDLARLDYAINAALMLAYVAANKGDRVGAMVFGEEVLGYMPPGKGRGQVARLAEFLYPIQPSMVESDYARAFSFFAAKNHKRSLVCVFSDLIDEEISGFLLAHLAALSPPHVSVCVTLRDPELDRAAGAEILAPATVYTKAVAEQVLADRAKARHFLERRGVAVVDAPPGELSVATVNKYLELKERGRI